MMESHTEEPNVSVVMDRAASGSTAAAEKPYRLRLPGPTAVPERVLQATARPIVNHRGPEFTGQLAEVVEMLRPVIGTANDILVYASSGTGVMEASLANVLAPGDKVLVLCNGQWGDRFIGIAAGLQLDVTFERLAVEWGEEVPIERVKERLAAEAFAAVIAIHNESSAGAVADLAAIGAAVRETPALLIVDSISGVAGIEMRQDDWGVDVLVTSSQKALMCPPGLGLASVSDKAWARIDDDTSRARFYWDFRKAREWAAKGQTAFTPPVSLISGLHEALTMIHEEGLDAVLRRHQRMAAALRAGGAAIGLKLFPTAPIVSGTVTVFEVPDGVDAPSVVKRMYEDHGSVIAGSRNVLKDRIIRIGTMGAVSADDILTDLAHLEATLRSLGVDVTAGAGVAAAREVLG
jgi:aspartate aminotransferase-like enzyme